METARFDCNFSWTGLPASPARPRTNLPAPAESRSPAGAAGHNDSVSASKSRSDPRRAVRPRLAGARGREKDRSRADRKPRLDPTPLPSGCGFPISSHGRSNGPFGLGPSFSCSTPLAYRPPRTRIRVKDLRAGSDRTGAHRRQNAGSSSSAPAGAPSDFFEMLKRMS